MLKVTQAVNSTFDLETVLQHPRRECNATFQHRAGRSMCSTRKWESSTCRATYGYSMSFWSYIKQHIRVQGRARIGCRTAHCRGPGSSTLPTQPLSVEYHRPRGLPRRAILPRPMLRERILGALVGPSHAPGAAIHQEHSRAVHHLRGQSVLAIQNVRLFDNRDAPANWRHHWRICGPRRTALSRRRSLPHSAS